MVKPEKPQDARTLLHVISEGILDGADPARIADVGFAAYRAIWRGAPADAVDGIALYGYQKKIAADSIATWANGYRDGTEGGVPGEVMADALVKSGLVRSVAKRAVLGIPSGWSVQRRRTRVH